MANVHDDTAGAEHPGFLQKIKDKLHIGHHHKDKEAASTTTPEATPDPAVSSKAATDVPPPAPPVKEEPHHATDLNSLVGHEAEHHGGTPTFLAALPDQDIPAEVTKETATSDAQGGEFFDSQEVFSKAQQGEHHEGVPTFLVALPDQDLPDEGTKEKLHHVTAGETAKDLHHSSGKDLDSEELFSNAQQGEHHEGVPTFLVALPDQDLPDEGTKEKLHHVTAGETAKDLHHSSGKDLDSEELFSNAQQGEHHGGVPTFLVALPDQEIPGEVNQGVASDVAGNDAGDSGVKQEFDSEEVFSEAQKGEHHEGVPTFLVALPDQDLPGEETKEKLHHVSSGRTDDA